MAYTTTQGGDTTVTFEYTAATAKVTAILNNAAHHLWNNGYGTITDGVLNDFGALTNTQKLAVVDRYIKDRIIAVAEEYSVKGSIDTARTDALTNLRFDA